MDQSTAGDPNERKLFCVLRQRILVAKFPHPVTIISALKTNIPMSEKASYAFVSSLLSNKLFLQKLLLLPADPINGRFILLNSKSSHIPHTHLSFPQSLLN